ncbi:nucleolar pre-ribosomal-associated protein 1 [Nitzschia inconspicua]|uniref:Nucleolar pre-ribosomal-associated protein 1 n=1 Tax=Nitzschia inconspicua TaxID=303405 RepID=A0A9K3LIU0_9STRA|nr:nucleolar pre-ribosomal-associated protein 1 [Nitzschia inconspicua]
MVEKEFDHKLRATEFAATLNDDNPQAILRVLRQFVATVRHERLLALDEKNYEDDSTSSGESEYDDDLSSESRDDGQEQNSEMDPPTKKYKKSEQWKMDSASYHVPFVGTAVARGEAAPVRKGEWPTGLLKAYLEKSPLATELLNEDLRPPNGQIHKGLLRKHRGRLSRAISKAHLLALAELVTVAVPVDKISQKIVSNGSPLNVKKKEGTNAVDPTWTRFLSTFVKEEMPWIFTTINEETGKGRGKMGEREECGSLVVPALKILQNVALVSTTQARYISRHLDESLSDGVLRVCLRSVHVEQGDDLAERPQNPSNRGSKKLSRTEAIKLGTILMQSDDPVVSTYIGTSGRKERKIKPGLIYIALREGLEAPSQKHSIGTMVFDDAYLVAVGGMLVALCHALFERTSRGGNNKLYFDLFSKDSLQNLILLASHAPRLTAENTYQDVLTSNDKYGNVGALQNTGIEARRLLFRLLSDRKQSPLLLRGECRQAVVCLVRLLEFSNTSQNLRLFIIFALTTSPFLLKDFFRMLDIPDGRNSFAFISKLSLVTAILVNGPSTITCLASARSIGVDYSEDDLVGTFLPSKLKGQTLTRALQMGNAIVRMECFKLVISVINQFNCLLQDNASALILGEESIGKLRKMLLHLIPDYPTLLLLQTQIEKSQTSGATLATSLLRVLEAVTTLTPCKISDSFEFSKVLPKDTAEFNLLLPGVQIKLLQFIQTQTRTCLPKSLLSSRCIFEIMVTTRRACVHTLCIEIVTKLMNQFFLPDECDSEMRECLEQEANAWVVSITQETIAEFFELLEEIWTKGSWTQMVQIGKAWKEHNQVSQKMLFSALLVAALSKRSVSPLFSQVVGQVASRCIFFIRDPLPLLQVVVSIQRWRDHLTGEDAFRSAIEPVIEYAGLLVNFKYENRKKIVSCLNKLLGALFSKNSIYVTLSASLANIETSAQCDCTLRLFNQWERRLVIPSIRFLNHLLLALSDSNTICQAYQMVLWHLQPLMHLMSYCTSTEQKLAASIIKDLNAIKKEYNMPFPDSLQLATNVLHFSSSFLCQESMKELGGSLFEQEGRANLLFCCILEKNLSSNERVEVAISLIRESAEKSSEEALSIASFFLRAFFEQIEYDKVEVGAWESVIDCWMWVSTKTQKCQKAIQKEIQSILALLMSKVLQLAHLGGAAVLTLLGLHPAKQIVDICLYAFEEKKFSKTLLDLLLELVKQDTKVYGPPLLSRLLKLDETLSRAWEEGFLDEVLAVAAKKINADDRSLLNEFIPRIADRLEKMLPISKRSRIDQVNHIAKVAFEMLKSARYNLCDMRHLTRTMDDALTQLFVTHPEDFLQTPAVSSICRFAHHVLLESDFECKQLGSHVFALIFISLPLSLKRKVTHVGSSGLTTRDALSMLIDMVHKPEILDQHELGRYINSNAIHKTTRACLKYGISLSHSEDDIPKLCLDLFSEMLRCSRKKYCPVACIVPVPGEILKMVTSHSKFKLLFAEQHVENSGEVEGTKRAVVELMTCCITASSNDLGVASSVWETLLKDLKGIPCDFDRQISTLIGICPYNVRPPMTSFRLGEVGTPNLSEAHLREEPFEWFVRGINPGRIHATISRFHNIFSADVNRNHDEIRNLAGPFSEDLADNTKKAPYDPVYFFPLLLATLEGSLIRPAGSESLPQLTSTNVATVRRLSDKGVVSLCFMGLSAACENLRLLATSSLGIILQVVISEQAMKESSWRSRPQLQIILDSVQRGLATEKAKDNTIMVPRVTPIVAIFLARAASVLQRPDDPLYVAMNRFFLKSELNHGAFQDFHRLPSFISLFCSESSDVHQARAERMWALQNVCDGLVDEASFRLVASCHAPELILTSFDNVRTSSLSLEMQGAEYCLLLHTLQAMIEYGGATAHSHLLRRGGLLPWMVSICNRGRNIHDFFPSFKTFTSFCDLLRAAIRALSDSNVHRTSLTSFEVCSFIRPILSNRLHCGFGTQHKKAVTKSALEVLVSIQNLVEILRKDGLDVARVQYLGASLNSSVTFMKLFEGEDSAQLEAVMALCALPISLVHAPSPEETIEFIHVVVQCCKRHSMESVEADVTLEDDKNDSFLLNALRRILALLEYLATTRASLIRSGNLLGELFAMRWFLCLSQSDVEPIWSKCLHLLLSMSEPSKDDDLSRLVRDKVISGCCKI